MAVATLAPTYGWNIPTRLLERRHAIEVYCFLTSVITIRQRTIPEYTLRIIWLWVRAQFHFGPVDKTDSICRTFQVMCYK